MSEKSVFNKDDPVIVVDAPDESMMEFVGMAGTVIGIDCGGWPIVLLPDGYDMIFPDHELAIDETRIHPIPDSVFWPGDRVQVIDAFDAGGVCEVGRYGTVVGSPKDDTYMEHFDVYVDLAGPGEQPDATAFHDLELELVEEGL